MEKKKDNSYTPLQMGTSRVAMTEYFYLSLIDIIKIENALRRNEPNDALTLITKGFKRKEE